MLCLTDTKAAVDKGTKCEACGDRGKVAVVKVFIDGTRRCMCRGCGTVYTDTTGAQSIAACGVA